MSVSTTNSDATVGGTQVVFKDESDADLNVTYPAGWNGFLATYKVSGGQKVAKIIINPQDASTENPSITKINYIKAVY